MENKNTFWYGLTLGILIGGLGLFAIGSNTNLFKGDVSTFGELPPLPPIELETPAGFNEDLEMERARDFFQCSDGIDNDGDGAVDYPADKQCAGWDDDNEEFIGKLRPDTEETLKSDGAIAPSLSPDLTPEFNPRDSGIRSGEIRDGDFTRD